MLKIIIQPHEPTGGYGWHLVTNDWHHEADGRRTFPTPDEARENCLRFLRIAGTELLISGQGVPTEVCDERGRRAEFVGGPKRLQRSCLLTRADKRGEPEYRGWQKRVTDDPRAATVYPSLQVARERQRYVNVFIDDARKRWHPWPFAAACDEHDTRHKPQGGEK